MDDPKNLEFLDSSESSQSTEAAPFPLLKESSLPSPELTCKDLT